MSAESPRSPLAGLAGLPAWIGFIPYAVVSIVHVIALGLDALGLSLGDTQFKRDDRRLLRTI